MFSGLEKIRLLNINTEYSLSGPIMYVGSVEQNLPKYGEPIQAS